MSNIQANVTFTGCHIGSGTVHDALYVMGYAKWMPYAVSEPA